MDNKKIYKICNDIIKNIDNIIKEGGVTIDREGKPFQLKSGFFTSIEGMEQTYNINNINIQKLKFNIIQNLQYINIYKNMFLGFWMDQNILYIDISKHFNKKQDAINFGIKNNQKAIYNIKDNKNEFITKKVYILYKYNALKNDINYLYEYNNIEDIARLLKCNVKSLYKKMNYSINNNIKMLDNNYCIFCESIEI